MSESETLDVGINTTLPDDLLYPGAPLTVHESLVSIFALAQSEKLSGSCLVRVMKLIELHCPKPNNCTFSLFKLFHQFEHVNTPLESYFHCSKCLKERNGPKDVCNGCAQLGSSVNQIIVPSLLDQLIGMYERSGFLKSIQYKYQRNKLHAENLEDIFDGTVYKNLEEIGFFLDSSNISLMWNTDGVCLYDSSTLQLWPLYLVINELPPEERFKRENLVLAAVYIGESKPHPNVFLKHVYENVQKINEGFIVKVADKPEPITVKAVIICGTCDSPAKAMMFNQKMFNGFYSCPKCLAKGEKSENTDDVMVHPYEENAPLRTDANYEEDATHAALANLNAPKTSRIASNGIKGPSYLYKMLTSMIDSTSVDEMHCVDLGLMKQLQELWFLKKYKNEAFSLYKVRHVVSHNLMKIKPPHFVKRLPRSLKQLANFKAYEFLLLLFYYLLPVLKSSMKQLYFHNFKLLVAGVSLLNQSSISIADIQKSKSLLTQFVKDFEELYGLRHMSFNIHLLLHLPGVVETLGPAFFSSCYGFEGLNGQLRNLVHGSRYAGSQLSSNIPLFMKLPEMVNDLKPGLAKDFCRTVTKKWKRVSIIELMFENSYSVGRYSRITLVPEWMSNTLNNQLYKNVFSFHHIKTNGILISSENYRRSTCNCSYFVLYHASNNYQHGSVKTFVKVTQCSCSEKCLCVGKFFALIARYQCCNAFETTNPPHSIPHIQQCEKTEIIDCVEVCCVKTVCFYVKVDDCMYLGEPLNKMHMYN